MPAEVTNEFPARDRFKTSYLAGFLKCSEALLVSGASVEAVGIAEEKNARAAHCAQPRLRDWGMITTELSPAMGLGNQLWSYAVCRTIATDRGLEFGIQSPHRFKGRRIMELDFGAPVRGRSSRSFSDSLPKGIEHYYREKVRTIAFSGDLIPYFDSELARIADNTKIDGYFQSERYIRHRKSEISAWFTVHREATVDENLCVVSVRGGDYLTIERLALGQKYYRDAIAAMIQMRSDARFLVITDDPSHAHRLLPDIETARASGPMFQARRLNRDRSFLGEHFALLQQAPMLIIANSSYAWWGAWTNPGNPLVIAPKYWVRHNTSDGYWHAGDSLTQDWLWMDRQGQLTTTEECALELEAYRSREASG